jgi:hypothetical protein
LVVRLTRGTEATQIESLGKQMVAGPVRHLSLERAQIDPINILDTTAARADHVGVRLWPPGIIPAATFAEIQRHDLAERLEQIQGVVDGGEAGARLFGDDGSVEVLHTWVRDGANQRARHSHPLRRLPVTRLPQGRHHLLNAVAAGR